jgi:hypothetical protein
MKLPTNLGMILLAVFLILYGLIALLGLSFHGSHYVMGGLAIASGVLLILGK